MQHEAVGSPAHRVDHLACKVAQKSQEHHVTRCEYAKCFLMDQLAEATGS